MTRRRMRVWAVALGLLIAAGGRAQAQVGSDRYSSIVVDAQSGQVLSSINADEYRFPASLTKLMTIYMVFEAIRDRHVALTDMVPVSPWAASMPPTKLGLTPMTTMTVEDALLSLVTQSANDAAAALGEMLGGDEDRFAQMMTLRARGLGMTRTTFRNASGLPDWGQVTTARDLVILARHLQQDFPQYYSLFSTPSFRFHGRTVLNHQAMLRTYPGADGMKTGYTEASGYNVVTSAVRGGIRLIGVVMGAARGYERDRNMALLLDQAFAREGVPVDLAHRESGPRLALMSAAQAAPMREAAEAPPVRASRGGRPRVQPANRAVLPPVYAPPPPPSRARASAAARSRTRAAVRGMYGQYEPRG